MAVAQARYHSVPFIQADSIDAGPNSLLRTMIELYAYKNRTIEGYSYDEAELAAAGYGRASSIR